MYFYYYILRYALSYTLGGCTILTVGVQCLKRSSVDEHGVNLVAVRRFQFESLALLFKDKLGPALSQRLAKRTTQLSHNK